MTAQNIPTLSRQRVADIADGAASHAATRRSRSATSEPTSSTTSTATSTVSTANQIVAALPMTRAYRSAAA